MWDWFCGFSPFFLSAIILLINPLLSFIKPLIILFFFKIVWCNEITSSSLRMNFWVSWMFLSCRRLLSALRRLFSAFSISSSLETSFSLATICGSLLVKCQPEQSGQKYERIGILERVEVLRIRCLPHLHWHTWFYYTPCYP